jgi:hypothetical protein
MWTHKKQGILFGVSQFKPLWISVGSVFLILSIQFQENVVDFRRKGSHRIYHARNPFIISHSYAGPSVKLKIFLCGHTSCLNGGLVDGQYQTNQARPTWRFSPGTSKAIYPFALGGRTVPIS